MQYARLLLWPFSMIYSLVTIVRNWLYDSGFRKSTPIPGASICIGNITVGGTGKSPLTIYIAEILSAFQPVILSRGYGRTTKGYRLANISDNASTLGDEPFMYTQHFGKTVPVAVAEERIIGVNKLRERFPESVILLDDAFQHRPVKAGLQLVLMTYDRPIFRDFPFPAGNLRESRNGLNRADVIVVTKCPESVSAEDKLHFAHKMGRPSEEVFFSSIVYGNKIPLNNKHTWNDPEIVLLVTGIANPKPLRVYLEKDYTVVELSFPDHHAFTEKDIRAIQQKVATFGDRRFAVLTTEKDAVRLTGTPFVADILALPFFYQQMTVQIDREKDFNELLTSYVTRTNERSR
jgi:tetraacyldisaccharide 4'-kinase